MTLSYLLRRIAMFLAVVWAATTINFIVPRLAPGVLVHVHDVFLPSDYPPDWDVFFGEQYMLAAMLLAGGDRLEVVLPNYFISIDPDLRAALEPLWVDPTLRGLSREGGSFWFRTR